MIEQWTNLCENMQLCRGGKFCDVSTIAVLFLEVGELIITKEEVSLERVTGQVAPRLPYRDAVTTGGTTV